MPVPPPDNTNWKYALLQTMGAPQSALCVDALQWWADSEGMPDWANNWLATTLSGYGGVPYNSAGVKAYPTVSDGINATWATLQGGAYVNVVANLRIGTSLQDIWATINSSPWCGGCQNGLYPVVLFNNLGATPSPVPTPGPGPPPAYKPGRGQDLAVTAWGGLQTALYQNANAQIHMLQSMANAAREFRA